LDATTAGANVYLWNDQSQNPVKEITASGVYSITASNGQCSGADSMEVLFFREQYLASTLNLGPSITECNGVVVSIDPSVPFGLTYEWEDGASGSFREFTEAGFYQLTGSLDECSISGSVEIIFEKCEAKVYVPNAFSPNNDGINDLFEIYGNGFAPVQLKIFNRWGGLVFSQTGNDFRWNGEVKGKPAQPGVYVYLLDYVDIYNGEGKTIWGNIMVIN
jgi:gliding motility-associated-like protein